MQLRSWAVSAHKHSSNIRSISSHPNSFPFPAHLTNPTPYEIFHLPYGCTQQQIKERYIDLVRLYHPDSPSCRLVPPTERHARFQAIRAAYDALRKADKLGLRNAHMFQDYAEEIARRKNVFHRQQLYRNRGPNVHRREYEPRYEWNSNADDRWKDRMIIGFGVASILIGVFPGLFLLPRVSRKRHQEALNNLSQARLEASEHGEQRRLEIKNRLKEIKSNTDR
ncbi:hypothetical protein GYMLUDRAFT_45961 [Collybiopsis luxurians FD-317 M1]|uniref:J domain-containing protein n=1 Tax=Collybiopsis luxurians FD-317 M1 TaxID=944289 RepID=A0A0D0B3B7_9AGAR|nr:hypothetical protein GYMLUDRAFT_45961 [Collybiopsis luxurians FD-317 M1]